MFGVVDADEDHCEDVTFDETPVFVTTYSQAGILSGFSFVGERGATYKVGPPIRSE